MKNGGKMTDAKFKIYKMKLTNKQAVLTLIFWFFITGVLAIPKVLHHKNGDIFLICGLIATIIILPILIVSFIRNSKK